MPCSNAPQSPARHPLPNLFSKKSCDTPRVGQRRIITETESRPRFLSARPANIFRISSTDTTPMPTRTRLHEPHLIAKLATSARIIFAPLILCLSLTAAALVVADDQPAVSSDAIIHHLSTVISWYRDSTTKVQPPGFASDAIYQGDAR